MAIYVHARSIHLLIFWILFENVMSMHRAKATIIGLLEASRVNEWVVTEKLGNALANRQSRNEDRNDSWFRKILRGIQQWYKDTTNTLSKQRYLLFFAMTVSNYILLPFQLSEGSADGGVFGAISRLLWDLRHNVWPRSLLDLPVPSGYSLLCRWIRPHWHHSANLRR